MLETSSSLTALVQPTEVAPIPALTFDALPLSTSMRQTVDALGWRQPTEVQLAVFEPLASGQDLIVQSPTGTGKTAAFGLPLIDRLVRRVDEQQVLILAPTRELASQSAKELQRLGVASGLRTTAVYGGVSMEAQVRELEAGAQIVSGTPGRVLDLLRRGYLPAKSLRVVVLDEADEMLSMGFIQELRAILDMLPTDRQTLLFSATVDNDVRRLSQSYMRNPQHVGVSQKDVGASDIRHFVYLVSGQARVRDLVRILEVENPEQAVIFCNTKAETEMVTERLRQIGFQAELLNGDLPQKEREEVLSRAHRRQIRYLVASDVAARGLDISRLTHVINFSFPESAEQYIHRTGRTGRAGKTGIAVSLVSPQEIGALYYLRLQYKITPIERQLPSVIEERSRFEVDRIALLDAAFVGKTDEADLAVARRLLSHPDAERIVAGLAKVFCTAYGESRFDADAAAKRRGELSLPTVEATSEAVAARPPASARSALPPTANASRGAGSVASTAGSRRSSRPPSSEPRSAAAKGLAPVRPVPVKQTARTDQSGDDHHDGEAVDGQRLQTLVLHVGRSHGIRASEVGRLLRDHAALGRKDIGRIRVRDVHTLVGIREDKILEVVKSLEGAALGEHKVAAELSKAN